MIVNLKMNLEKLVEEYSNWLGKWGRGRNQEGLRFGQYIHLKWRLDETTTNTLEEDGFYAEDPAIAFEQISKILK